MTILRVLLALVLAFGITACGQKGKFRTYNGPSVTSIQVHKAARKMYLLHNSEVLEEYDVSLHLQQLLRAAGQPVPISKPVLEINPGHPLLKRLEGEQDGIGREDLALLLLEQAQLAEGNALDDPAAFIQRVNRLLVPYGGATDACAAGVALARRTLTRVRTRTTAAADAAAARSARAAGRPPSSSR